MADTTDKDSKEREEEVWRERVLEELHRISRALDKIADRIGGVSGA
jgi:hypothetical protein